MLLSRLRMEKKTEDFALISKIKEKGCNESYQTLCDRHENLFFKICQKYIPLIESIAGINREDVLQDKHFVIYKALSSYKNNKKTKFSTWLGNCTKYHCLNFLNSNKKTATPGDDFVNYQLDKKSLNEKPQASTVDIDFIFNILEQLKDERIVKVFRLRYFGEFGHGKKPTWSRIARQINTSTQTAINLHRRGRAIIKKKMSSHPSRADTV